MNTPKMKTLAAIVLVAVSSQAVTPAFASAPADLQTQVQTLLTSGARSTNVTVPGVVATQVAAIDKQVQQVLSGTRIHSQTLSQAADSPTLSASTQRPVSSILLGSM